MRRGSFVSSVLVVVGLAAGAAAQTPAPDPTETQPQAATSAPVNADRLGLNLSRIQRELKRTAERHDYDGLNLRYYVNVFAPAPPIRLFTPLDNLLYGPAPYGGPTHRDMMQIMTPQEFSAPAADLTGVARWFTGKGKK